MIYDNIDNHGLYAGISEDIRIGLEYLRDLKPDIEKGVYELTPRVKAIVSEYTTKEENEYGYEAHREYIDIQYLISGSEKICCLPLEYLKETKPYNKEIDAAFYVEDDVKPQEFLLGNGYFAILYPQDGHMPQLCVDEPCSVKKVVVKVKI
jgi:YhcH/YjgK/YiaL family protein